MRHIGTHLSIFAVTCAWGGAFVSIKYLLNVGMSPMDLTVGRFVIVGAILLAILIAHGRRNVWPTKRDWPMVVVVGILGAPVYHLALNYGETRITASAAGVLVGTSPVLTALLSAAMLRERFTAVKIAGVAIAFVGVTLVVLFGGGGDHGGRMSLAGFLITMIAPVSWALYNVLSKPLAGRLPSFQLTAYTALVGSILLMALWRPSTTRSLVELSTAGWLVLIYLGAICTVVGYIVWYRGLRVLSATQVAVYVYFVPVGSLILSRILLRERITPFLAIGTALIIGGIVLANIRQRVAGGGG